MTPPNPNLISDLARLAGKYKLKDWQQLAAWLDDEEQRAQLRTLLTELGGASERRHKRPSRKKAKSPSRAAAVRDALAKIRKSDPATADLLDDIWLRLRQRELLPTIATLRTFAEATGSKGLLSNRRDQAVPELMEHLIELPADTLEERVRQAAVGDRDLGDEYDRWVQLILGRPTLGTDGPSGG